MSVTRGAAVEAACLATHVWHYPWGLGNEHVTPRGSYAHHRTDRLSPSQRGLIVSDLSAAATPVLLVHGIADNRSIFTMLRMALRRRGHGMIHAVNYSMLTPVRGDIREAARELGQHVERLRTRSGADTVHIIGHSLGGLIARYYVQRLGGHETVDSLVTIGTAHQGSLMAELLPPTRMVRQLRPGSDLIEELHEPAPDCRARFLCVWSHADPTMVPRRSATLEHPDLDVEHLELEHVGHLAMVVDPTVVHRVLAWLTSRAPADRRAA